MFVTTISVNFVSCDGDNNDVPKDPSSGSVSNLTKEQIQSTFSGLRIDSIHSSDEWNNIKMEYADGLLISYKECYPDGSVHDGVDFKLVYTPDTIYVNRYKAVIGNNGLVSQLICPTGKVNKYEYDNDSHIIKYDIALTKQNDRYYELNWENGNISSVRDNSYEAGTWMIYETSYTYSEDINIGGILPSDRSWIDDSGYSVGYGINNVLYYAGLLGRGTKNLPKSCSYRYQVSTNKYYEYKGNYVYRLDDSGYVIYSKDSDSNSLNYFYK